MFCPECGVDHHAEVVEDESPVTVVEAESVTDKDVEIAKINAKRDVDLARISAGMIDHDRDVQAARVEGKAEALEQVIEPPEPEPEPEPEPVIIDAPDTDTGIDDSEEPPPADDHSPHEPKKSRGLGFW